MRTAIAKQENTRTKVGTAVGTVALSDASGQIVERYRYDVFGRVEIRSATGESLPESLFGNRFLFTGREHLSEIGLYDYRNRVYSAELGRFLQTDPIRFSAGDGNLYRYVGNDPVNLWDPWGLCEEDSYSWNDLLLDLASLGLTAADLALGGPTGEGIGPALAIQAAKQAGKQSAKEAAKKAFREEAADSAKRVIRDRNTGHIKGVGADNGSGYRPKSDGSYTVTPKGGNQKNNRHYRPDGSGGHTVNNRD